MIPLEPTKRLNPGSVRATDGTRNAFRARNTASGVINGRGAAPQAIPFDVEYSDETDVRLMPEQPVGVLVQPRPRRRMNVDQLQNAMAQVSGGIGWTERQPQ